MKNLECQSYWELDYMIEKQLCDQLWCTKHTLVVNEQLNAAWGHSISQRLRGFIRNWLYHQLRERPDWE